MILYACMYLNVCMHHTLRYMKHEIAMNLDAVIDFVT